MPQHCYDSDISLPTPQQIDFYVVFNSRISTDISLSNNVTNQTTCDDLLCGGTLSLNDSTVPFAYSYTIKDATPTDAAVGFAINGVMFGQA